ncbi:unnamed protein product [Auanema sp. JU1783]|nr:unnamed protein product [Auanema sp. JU1783]
MNILRTPLVVSTVLTTAERFQHRQVIRETWANQNNSKNIKNGNVKVYFLLSNPKNSNIRKKLDEEQELYNDIIITNLTESYHNLYQKVYAAFLFVQAYYPRTTYHMKVDDDVLIEMDRMFHFLQNNRKSSIMCKVWPKSAPKRNRKHKWFISREQWSSNYYPKYCDGPMYMIGHHALKSLTSFSRQMDLFPFEDVFYTGIIPEAANVTRISWSDHILHYNTELWWNVSECDKSKMPLLFAVHSLNTPSKMRFGYKILRNLTCISHNDLLLKRTEFYEKKKGN